MYFNIFWMVYQVVLLGVGMMMGKMVQQQPAIITHSSPVEKEYSSVGMQTEGAVKDETDDCEDDVTRKASMLGECSSEIASKVDTPWDDLVLKLDDLTFETDPATNEWFLIGSGKFGNVYKAKLFGTEDVAVKCVKNDAFNIPDDAAMDGRSIGGKRSASETNSSDSLSGMKTIEPSEKVLREVALLKACRSQHVVSFLGACFLQNEVRLVTELMPAGDLWTALRRQKISWHNGGLQVAKDIATGLHYLHEKRVIHLDLKSSNILLRWNGQGEFDNSDPSNGFDQSEMPKSPFRAKVSDVGLARILPDTKEYILSLDGGGTWNWCAPEVILGQKCTAATDMWSFGVILWELATCEIPVRSRMREVKVPEECPQAVADLIERCNHVNGKDRPTAAAALKILQECE